MTCFTTTGTKLPEDKFREQKHSPHEKSGLNFQQYYRPGTTTPLQYLRMYVHVCGFIHCNLGKFGCESKVYSQHRPITS